MAATYYTLLTTIGQASIANAVALGEMVNLTNMAVGDGNGNPTTPNENQTALVRERYRASINQLTVDPANPNYIISEMIVPTSVGGWSVNEVGVFDDHGQLIAVANFPATYKPVIADGSGRDLIIRIIIQVSNSSVVTLKIDPAVVLASQAWVAANFVKKVTVAGGTTGQILAKKSNANEDFQWVDPTAAVDVNVFSREESQTLAASQVIIDLAEVTTDGSAVYVEGVRLRDDQFTVNSSTRLTLATSYPAGTKVTVVQNEETSRNAFMLKSQNLADLVDKALSRTNLGLKTAAVRDVGTGASQIPDMASFLSANADTGYQKLPSGVIIQWGLAAGTLGVLAQKAYPIAFPNAALHVYLCHNVPNDANGIGISGAKTAGSTTLFDYMPQGIKISGTTVTAAAAGSAAISMHFLAIGY